MGSSATAQANEQINTNSADTQMEVDQMNAMNVNEPHSQGTVANLFGGLGSQLPTDGQNNDSADILDQEEEKFTASQEVAFDEA
jgi:hypothetical protein